VLTVAATQPDGSVAPWSSRARWGHRDTAAPIWEAEDGTSFSSPLVAGAAAWIWTVRPTLDAGQVAQVLRASATDTGGRPRLGLRLRLLNLPAVLSAATPVKDSFEPNDDAGEVTPGGEGYHGTPAFTRVSKTSDRTSGSVDSAEDPRDVYRVWLPKGKRFQARLMADGALSLRLVQTNGSSIASVRTSSGGRLSYRNAAAGRCAFVVLAPSTAAATTYALSVSALPLGSR
jgi:hypothetical protein